jgi:glycerol-3-phosphate cytidylyltransferase-like family protein
LSKFNFCGIYENKNKINEIAISAKPNLKLSAETLNSDVPLLKKKDDKEERKEIILSLDLCDGVLPNSQPDGTVKDIVLCAGADLIVIGSDWARKDYLKQIGLTYDWLDEKNISLCYVPYTKGISTSAIKQRLKEQN